MAAPFKNCVLVVCCAFFLLTSTSKAWEAHFEPNSTTLHMSGLQTINITLTGLNGVELIQNKAILSVSSESEILAVSSQLSLDDIDNGAYHGQFNISGIFLGTTKVYANITEKGILQRSNETLNVVIVREERLIDRIFTASIIALVSILYINFGAALDLGKVKEILVRPIGPLIAFVCQFLFMPLVSVLFLLIFIIDVIFHLTVKSSLLIVVVKCQLLFFHS